MKENIIKKDPIGARIKKADYVFTNLTRKTKNNGSFNRLEWQLFHFLKQQKRTTANEIVAYLRFLDEEQAIHSVINRFINEGLILKFKNEIVISSKGEQVYEELLEIQEEIQEKALKGISESAYITTTHTLQQITDNLREYLP